MNSLLDFIVFIGRCYYTKKWLFYFLLLLNARKEKKDKKIGNQSTQTGEQSNRKQRGYGKTVTDPEQLEACPELEDHPNVGTHYINTPMQYTAIPNACS